MSAAAAAVEQEQEQGDMTNTNPNTVPAVAVAEMEEAYSIQTSSNCPNSHRGLSEPVGQVGVGVEGTMMV